MKRSRRTFLQRSLGCAGYLAAGLAMAPTQVRRTFAARPQRPVVAEREFARLEQLGDGVWAVVSTPLKNGERHFQTTSNGGIIQGSEGVLAIEGYYSDEGAGWVAGLARELTGRVPTRVVVTHFHADHCHGLPGLQAADAGLASYLDLLRELEHVARRAFEGGVPATDAAADYSLPESLGEWVMFSPDYIERALQAWHRELRPGV